MDKAASLDGLIEFVAAAEMGSFSAAARSLGVSVAHVSRRVAELERGLGLQLIQRTSRQSVLTEAGRSYQASCRAVLEDLEETRQALRRDQPGRTAADDGDGSRRPGRQSWNRSAGDGASRE